MTTIIDALNSVAFTALGQPTSWMEVIGFVTGAICVWLVAKQNIFNWPIGIANNVAFIVLFVSAGLFADAGLQVAYIVLAVWGWHQWLHGGPARKTLPVTRSSRTEWAWIAAAVVALTALLLWVLATFSTSTVPLADAATTALSLGATYGQIRKRVGSWYLWIAADVIYIPLYMVKGLELTAVLYMVFMTLCFIGLRDWRSELPTTHRGLRNRPLVGAAA